MLRTIDRIADLCGTVAGWLFFIIGAMISFEVVARYVFTAPTIWAEELSRTFQVWAVYMGAAYVLRHGYMIRITMLTDRLSDAMRRAAEAFTLTVVIVFSGISVWWGADIAIPSFLSGETTGSVMNGPIWIGEAAVPLGGLLLLLQALAQLIRLLRGEELDFGRIEEQL